jgi:murein DD-endopeptidase MepM/ murein hydrolase activator NlpD
MAGNISSSGSSGGPSGGKKKYGGLFGAFDRLSDVFSAILNGEDDDGSASPSGGANSPGGALANGGVPANTGLDYMLKNMPGAQVTSNYKDESGRPTPGEHGGIDIAADENTPVPTPVSGTVQDAGTEDGYGNYVQVKDKNGNYHLFGHLNQHKVKTGDTVTRGSIVGLEGSTGHSTGPHVHYQIDPPDTVNAMKSGPHLDPSTYSLNGLGKWGAYLQRFLKPFA